MQLVYVLDAIISEIVREMGFDEEMGEQVNLAVIEAGTNAIKHGNKEDPNKRARFEFIVEPDRLTVVVEDQGKGFDRTQVADPLDPANLLKSSGRGIFLMEACMDEVIYNESGTLVTMIKKKKLTKTVSR
jgi:serine/threonine-protein kinase RsbW